MIWNLFLNCLIHCCPCYDPTHGLKYQRCCKWGVKCRCSNRILNLAARNTPAGNDRLEKKRVGTSSVSTASPFLTISCQHSSCFHLSHIFPTKCNVPYPTSKMSCPRSPGTWANAPHAWVPTSSTTLWRTTPVGLASLQQNSKDNLDGSQEYTPRLFDVEFHRLIQEL